MCVLIKDIGRRLPLELQCSLYQRAMLVSLCAETIDYSYLIEKTWGFRSKSRNGHAKSLSGRMGKGGPLARVATTEPLETKASKGTHPLTVALVVWFRTTTVVALACKYWCQRVWFRTTVTTSHSVRIKKCWSFGLGLLL